MRRVSSSTGGTPDANVCSFLPDTRPNRCSMSSVRERRFSPSVTRPVSQVARRSERGADPARGGPPLLRPGRVDSLVRVLARRRRIGLPPPPRRRLRDARPSFDRGVGSRSKGAGTPARTRRARVTARSPYRRRIVSSASAELPRSAVRHRRRRTGASCRAVAEVRRRHADQADPLPVELAAQQARAPRRRSARSGRPAPRGSVWRVIVLKSSRGA